MRFLAALTLLVAGLGCGTKAPLPDAGPVPDGPKVFVDVRTVIASGLPQDVMLLVSRSGSMLTNTSIDPPCPPTIGGCGFGSPCPAGCPTRLDEMRTVLGSFIDANAKTTRFAVAAFPSNDFCDPTGTSAVLLEFPPTNRVDDVTSLRAQAAKAKAALAGITPGGMAPIAGSLRFLDAWPAFVDSMRRRVVLLVTDGAPNCNGGNPHTCSDALSCRCTQSECSSANGLCVLGCNDDDDAAAEIDALRRDQIQTVVVGVGSGALEPDTIFSLNKLASADDFSQSCFDGSPGCGDAGPCDTTTHLCARQFYVPSAGDALNTIFDETSSGDTPDPCSIILTQNPQDLAHLTVRVDGRAEAPCASRMDCNTWVFEHDGTVASVLFQGTTCDALRQSTVLTPVTLRFEIVK